MTYHEMREVLRAAERKEQIQCRSKISDDSPWQDIANPSWNFHLYDYRTKPKARRWWLVFGEVHYPRVYARKSDAEVNAQLACKDTIVEVVEVQEPSNQSPQ